MNYSILFLIGWSFLFTPKLIMKKKILFYLVFLLLASFQSIAQTKVSGRIKDTSKVDVSYASVYFKNSTQGVIANELGKFYLETENNYDTLVVSFVGYKTAYVPLKSRTNLDLSITLEEDNMLEEVRIFTGKTSKKNNPAIDILRKIWERKRKNGLYMFSQYEFDKYEKIEFDLNSIDSAYRKKKIFKGMEFIFDQVDTNRITGKTYLPIFINENIGQVFGDNVDNKKIEKTLGNKNSGFDTNQHIIEFVKDLYAEYNIYNNYIKIFDKDFVSPLSRTGINVYNYVLADSAFIDDKWCYNIVYYPRRKGELTFKGDFWVNDSTFAIKKINMEASRDANINWVKEIYIEQEFDVLNDSVFLLTRDHFMSDFALSKKEESKGIYGKRTTVYQNHQFNIKHPDDFYKKDVNEYDESIYTRSDDFWQTYRFEPLSKDEFGIYKMLDTLKTVPKFRFLFDLTSTIASNYYNIPKYNFDYGPIFSTFGYNDIEGLRMRAGGRTYFGPNDKWRLEGYGAYGFKDNKFKYGISGKVLLHSPSRFILFGGNRRDVEQIGVSLTETNDVLGRSFASSSLFASGDNSKLTDINLSTVGLEIEPVKNLRLLTTFSYRTLKPASDLFNLDYYVDKERTIISNETKQSEVEMAIDYTPGKRTIGYGVDRKEIDQKYLKLYLRYSHGFKGAFDSNFQYDKLQLYARKPILLGGFGTFTTTFEAGKTFGEVPLGLLSVVPGNQSWFNIENTFANLDYYEFVTNEYASIHLEHNFGGRLLSRIPWFRDLNLREIVGIRGIYGKISQENINLNASQLVYKAPEDFYYEYYVGVGNIFKIFRLDLSWRGNYLDMPDARRFAIRGSFGIYF
ncbi:TonB-linked outer membrane protein, SusC/RagA family [Myroides odoratus]|uniref:TonB-linked outer membrane protein, SusC/RagA family n=2 Tax=Myroides odoratus TaxID=256 RepID=A0A378U3P3_MYROD|nr:TonB-linked outer membrane protein, SusC/RagA family [Myroides odoratus]